MFDFKLQGADSISKEYKAFKTQVYRATQAGLMAVGSELTKQLQKHIQTEVYNGYEPLSYERRVTHGGGTPIISAKNMDMEINGMSLTFRYEPSGKNTRYPTSKYVDGDQLINAIENSKYTWDGTEDIPERHFWNHFVDEMLGANGQAEKILIKGMNNAEPDLQVKADGRIEQDRQDTLFAQQLNISNVNSSFGDEDGDLPY